MDGVNERVIRVADPWNWRNWSLVLLGLLTGWISDDLGFGAGKAGWRDVEGWVEGWNRGREVGVRVWPLRRTGFLNVSGSSFISWVFGVGGVGERDEG